MSSAEGFTRAVASDCATVGLPRTSQTALLMVDTQMNWRLGLLRLWVVATLLWLVACGGWALFQWRDGIGARFPVTDPNGLKFVVTAPVGTAKADVLPFMRNSAVVKKWQADCGKERSAPCRQEILVQMPGVTEYVVRFWVFTISMPVVVLVLGLICVWVILGFRKPVIPKS